MSTYIDELRRISRKPPEGAFTAAEACAASGLSDSSVRRKVAADVATGRLDTDTFLVNRHTTRYYWEKSNASVRKR